jgi:[acyl-carrier-protein] S-malonyltransferase
MNKFILLCPGQGGQHAGMFDLARSDPATAVLLDSLDATQSFGMTLAAALAQPTAMFDNVLAQPLVVAATLANWHAIRTSISAPSLIAGYSIGEVSAHAVSGALDIVPAIELARQRALSMQACVQPGAPHQMLAVSGIPVQQLTAFAGQHDLHVAIITGDNGAIIAGLESAMALALPALQQVGGLGSQLTPLPVQVASHTPLMRAAAPALAKLLEQARFEPPAAAGASQAIPVTVVAGVSAALVVTAEQARATLLAQLTQPLQWSDCMDLCDEQGVAFALELGPGSALSKMLQARHPQMSCRSVDQFRSLTGVIDWVRRQSAADGS